MDFGRNMEKEIEEVIKELYQANFKHNLFVSEHEGMGVLQEEVYELWDAIRSNKPEDVYHEATQVAAMAVKLMMYINSIRSRHSDNECDCENREKYGDAFDSMFGNFQFPKI